MKNRKSFVMLIAVLVLSICLTMAFSVTAFADNEEEGLPAVEINTAEPNNETGGAEATSTEEAFNKAEAEEPSTEPTQKEENPAADTQNEETEKNEEASGQETIQDGQNPIEESPKEQDEEPAATEPETIQESVIPADSGLNYAITVTDQNGNSVDVTGGTETAIADILGNLGYEIGEDTIIEVDYDSVDTNVVSVTENAEGKLVLSDNGPFGRAAKNMIVYVNGVAIELELVDPTEISGGSMSGETFIGYFGGDTDSNVQLLGNVTITDGVLNLAAGTHDLYLNGQTLDLGSFTFNIDSGATLNVYGGASATETGNGKITGTSTLFNVLAGGVLNIYSGTPTTSGATIISKEDEGTAIIYGGTLRDNLTSASECVYVDSDRKAYASSMINAGVNAPDGSTIYMLKNVDLSENGKYSGASLKERLKIYHSVTVDLGGYQLYGGDTFYVKNGSTVKVINGEIYSASGCSCVGVSDSGTLYVENVKLTGNNAFYSNNTGTHTYLGEGVVSTCNSIYSSNGGGILHITDGIYTFNSLDATGATTAGDKLYISGGCFSKNISSYLISGYTIKSCEHGRSNYHDVVLDESKIVAELHHTDAAGETVTKFGELSKAIIAAANGDTVKMLKNINENVTIASGKNITLDLNGKVLSASNSSAALITLNGGNLTVTDSNPDAVHYFKKYKDTTCTTYVYQLVESAEDGAIVVNGGIIYGEKIRNSSNTPTPSVAVNSGSLTMNARSIVGSYAHQGGAAIYVKSGATAAITGTANIEGNGSARAAIFNEGTITMSGGTIRNNTSSWQAAAIKNNGLFTMTGGEITGNETFVLGGASAISGRGTSNLLGGTISGNKSNGSYGAVAVWDNDQKETKGTWNIGGTIVIKDNYCNCTVSTYSLTGGTENNLYLTAYNSTTYTVNVSTDTPLTAGACIGVTTMTAPTSGNAVDVTSNGTKADMQYFHSDVSGISVLYEKNSANTTDVVRVGYPVAQTGEGTDAVQYSTVQKAVDAAGTTATTIKMLANSTENVTIATGKNITLDLNGKVLKPLSTTASTFKVSGTLTLKDTSIGVTHHFTENANGLWTWDENETATDRTVTGGIITGSEGKAAIIVEGGTFIMEKGNIVGNNNTESGAGVYVDATNGGTFEMKGGLIAGNIAAKGGGVALSNGKFTMTGGEISSNTAATDGGGVLVMDRGIFTMTGGKITGNTAATNGGGVYYDNNSSYYAAATVTLGGTAEIKGNKVGTADNNLYLIAGAHVVVKSGFAGSVGVTTATRPNVETSVKITAKNDADYKARFTSDVVGYYLTNDKDNFINLCKSYIALGNQVWVSDGVFMVPATSVEGDIRSASIVITLGKLQLTTVTGSGFTFKNAVISSSQADSTPVVGTKYTSVQLSADNADAVKTALDTLRYTDIESDNAKIEVYGSPTVLRDGDYYIDGHYYTLSSSGSMSWDKAMEWAFNLQTTDPTRYPGYRSYPVVINSEEENQMLVNIWYNNGSSTHRQIFLPAVPVTIKEGTGSITVSGTEGHRTVTVTGQPTCSDVHKDEYGHGEVWMWMEGTPAYGTKLYTETGITKTVNGHFWAQSNPTDGGMVYFGHPTIGAYWDDLAIDGTWGSNVWSEPLTNNLFSGHIYALAEWEPGASDPIVAEKTLTRDGDYASYISHDDSASYTGDKYVVNGETRYYYTKVQDAVTNAQDKDALRLVKSVSENVALATSMEITLQLNGKTLTGNLTAENGTVKLTDSNGTVNGNVCAKTAGTVVMENGTVTGNISSEAGGTMTITGGKHNGSISKADGSTMTITGGKFSNNPTVYLDTEHAAKSITEDPYFFEVVGGDQVVCSDGTHGYASIQDAIDAGVSPITLMRDTSENIEIPSGTDVTIDLNGKTLRPKDNTKPIITVDNGGTLTLDNPKGGTITGGGTGIKNDGTLTIDGKTKISGNDTGIGNNGTLTVKGETEISGNDTGIETAGTTTLEGETKITGNKKGVDKTGGTLTLKDETEITGNNKSGKECNLYLHNGQTVDVDDSFTGKAGVTTEQTIVPGVSVSVTGPESKDFSGNLVADGDDVYSYDVKGKDGKHTLKLGAAAVKVGDKKYGSIQDAIEDAGGEPVTIELISDCTENIEIPDGADVTIDLKGKKLTAKDDGSVITVKGTLTLNDSSDDKTGTITGGKGTVTGPTTSGGGVFVDGGSFTMNGGTITGCEAGFGGGVEVFGGSFAMNGGTITGNTATDAFAGSAVDVQNGGSFTMSGGVITGNTAPLGSDVYVYSGAADVKGGSISGKLDANEEYGKISLESGFYSEKPDAKFIASGYMVVENTDPATKDMYPFKIVPVPTPEPQKKKIVVPVEDGDTVPVEAEIIGDKAVVTDVSKDIIDEVLNAEGATGTVTIDCSLTDSEINRVELRTSTIKTVADSIANELKVVMNSGSIGLDKAAVKAAADNAETGSLILVIEDISENTLNGSQKSAVDAALAENQNAKLAAVVDAYILAGSSKVRDLGDGSAKLELNTKNIRNLDLSSGTVTVYEIAEDGTMTKIEFEIIDGAIVFNAKELSSYIITTE